MSNPRAGNAPTTKPTVSAAAFSRSISIVVPVYNEESVIGEFYRRIVQVRDALPFRCELIFVNDGSRDSTLALLQSMRDRDPSIGIVDLSRNFGKEIALTAGLDHATGDAVIVIDADLQDPPELIPTLIDRWRDGDADVVFAQRISRGGETWLKKVTAHGFYRLMNALGGQMIPSDTGDFRLLDRRAVDALKTLRERHRFMKGLFAWIGFRQTAVTYRRDPRFAGETKWNYWKLWNFSIEGITSFSTAPLKFSTYFGILVAASALAYGLFIVARTLLFGSPVPGYPSLLVAILFMGGVQMISLGIVGEYVGRIFNEAKQRPLYLLKEFMPSQIGPAAESEGKQQGDFASSLLD